MPVAKHTTLYSLPDSPKGVAKLKGRRCDCGYTFFPPQDYGCEACGAGPEKLSPVDLSGRGVLESFVTVHKHRFGTPKPPFCVGTIRLDDGPSIVALLACADEEGLAIGQTVQAIMVDAGQESGGDAVVECQFSPVDSGQGGG